MVRQSAILFGLFLTLSTIAQLRETGQVQTGVLSDTILLEDVTISVLPFGETYQEATGGVFTLRIEDIARNHSMTSTDWLNLAPGVYMASGTYNTSRLVIRGIGSRTPYSSNRIRAYLDDIPLTSGDGVSTLEDLDLMGIGQIELLKGPSSALYGSGLGGIVRLVSPYPDKEGYTATLAADVGSFRTGRIGLRGTYKKNKLAATGGITRSMSEGFRENSEYLRTNAFLNATYFGNRNSLSLTLSLVDLYSRIPSSLNESDFENHPEKAAQNWLDIKGFEEYTKLLAGVNIKTDLGSNVTNHLVLFSSLSNPYESRPFNILDDRSSNLGFRETLQYEKKAIKLSAGFEYFHEWYDWQIHETINGSRGTLMSDQHEIRKYANTFMLLQWRPTARLLIDGGFNLNFLQYILHTDYRSDSADQSGSYKYPPVFSPRIGLSFKLLNQHHLYASAGHGFSAPSLEETLLPEGMINTDLKPETGWNLELGNRGAFLQGRIRYDVTIYTIFLNNLLVTERLAEDIFTGANAGNAINSGMELWSRLLLFPGNKAGSFEAVATLGYTISNNRFTDFIDDGIDYSGNLLPGIPLQRLNKILSVRFGPAEAGIHYQFTGSQWMNDANDQKYNAYQLFHLRVKWKLHFSSTPFSMVFHGRISNLFNVNYASMILVNAPSFGTNAPRYYYPGFPRQFQLGVTLSFR